jgi:hypothetical protein
MTKKQIIGDQNGVPVTIGDLVFFNLYSGEKISRTILGKVKKIDGAYVLVANVRIKAQVWELYSVEFEKADDDKAALWLLEN